MLAKEAIINNVYDLRVHTGATQEQIADVLGVTRQTIIAIEKGNYIPSLLLAYKISRFFNRSIEDIFLYERK